MWTNGPFPSWISFNSIGPLNLVNQPIFGPFSMTQPNLLLKYPDRFVLLHSNKILNVQNVNRKHELQIPKLIRRPNLLFSPSNSYILVCKARALVLFEGSNGNWKFQLLPHRFSNEFQFAAVPHRKSFQILWDFRPYK